MFKNQLPPHNWFLMALFSSPPENESGMLRPASFSHLATPILAALLAVASLQSAWAYPQPELVSQSWQLDITYGTPDAIAIPAPDGQVRWYWYLPYKVVNHSGADHLFLPEAVVLTDRGQIIEVDRAVPASIFRAIQDRLNNPLLESPASVIGTILQGPDHAKESILVWRHPAQDTDAFTIFFAGLSGENKKTINPVTGQPTLLRKTLQLDYITPGSSPSPQIQTIQFKAMDWVMR